MKLKEVLNRNYRKKKENIRLESRKNQSGVNFKPGTLGFVCTEEGQMGTNFQQYYGRSQ